MILVKCTVLDEPERLKHALDPDSPCLIGYTKFGKFKQKLLDTKEETLIHTSAILKNYPPTSDSGLIFETGKGVKPHAVLPLDLLFFPNLGGWASTLDVEDWLDPSDESSLEIVSILREKFVFKSVKQMCRTFSTSTKALNAFKKIMKKHVPRRRVKNIIDSIKFGLASEFRHNEVIFLNKIQINPLAFFGEEDRIKAVLEMAKLSSDLELYPTAEAYFKEKKITYT